MPAPLWAHASPTVGTCQPHCGHMPAPLWADASPTVGFSSLVYLSSSIPESQVDGSTVDHDVGAVVVKDSRHVLAGERVASVGDEETCLTNRAVTHHHTLDVLHPTTGGGLVLLLVERQEGWKCHGLEGEAETALQGVCKGQRCEPHCVRSSQ